MASPPLEVLLIEDDRVLGGAVAQRLELEGMAVRWCETRAHALTALRTDVTANLVIAGKLEAEGYTVDDVIAVRTDASGSTLVYVDDRS